MIFAKMTLKIFIILLLVTTITSLMLSVYLSLYYMQSMPRSPQPDIGLVFPLNIHGTIVYVTKQQDSFLTWSFWIGFSTGLTAGIINVRYKIF